MENIRNVSATVPTTDASAVFQGDRRFDFLVVQLSAVLAAEIFERGASSVTTIRAWRRETLGSSMKTPGRRVSPDHGLAGLQGDSFARVQDPAGPAAGRARGPISLLPRRLRRTRSRSDDGPHVARLLGLVADHIAHFDQQTRQRAVRNEGSRPEPLVDLQLRDGLRPIFEEKFKELERLGLYVNRLCRGRTTPASRNRAHTRRTESASCSRIGSRLSRNPARGCPAPAQRQLFSRVLPTTRRAPEP